MKRKFSPHGLLALSPAAVDAEFDRASPRAELAPDLALVTIRGPLFGYADADGHFDSYEAVRRRVELALACDAPMVVLAIDSPGGLASGFLELARDIRSRAASAGKELVAYVDGQACSAAYGLACAASRIFVGESAAVGSIGIIDTLADQTALDRASGLRIKVVASGERKTDGNPHVPMTDGAIEASRARVEQLASSFFAFVGGARVMSPAKVRALEAGVFMGAEGVRAGLADRVCTFDQMLAVVRGKTARTAQQPRVTSAAMSAQASTHSGPSAAIRSPTMSTPPKPPGRTAPQRSAPRAQVSAPRMTRAELDTRIAAIETEQRAQRADRREQHTQVELDPELAAVDRAMAIGAAPASKAERRGNTLYLGRAPGVERFQATPVRAAKKTPSSEIKATRDDRERYAVERKMGIATKRRNVTLHGQHYPAACVDVDSTGAIWFQGEMIARGRK